jgi:hypothetical protein
VPWPYRPAEVYPLWQGSPGVELLCYTPEEFPAQEPRDQCGS